MEDKCDKNYITYETLSLIRDHLYELFVSVTFVLDANANQKKEVKEMFECFYDQVVNYISEPKSPSTFKNPEEYTYEDYEENSKEFKDKDRRRKWFTFWEKIYNKFFRR